MFNLIIDEIPSNFDQIPEHRVTLEELPDNFDARD